MAESIVENVSDTALWVAHYRAQESQRSDALFRDPYASILVGDRGREIAETMNRAAPYTGWVVVIRTHIIDAFLSQLLAEGVDMIVNLGCGLDTRPYRMNLPRQLQWVEVDYPHMIAHKEKTLAHATPTCRLERVGLDLADRSKRQQLFSRLNNTGKKIVALTEGVIPYLSEDEVRTLGEDLRAQSNFDTWIAEYYSPDLYKYFRNTRWQKKMKNAPFRFYPQDWYKFFAGLGWQPRVSKYIGEESIGLGRMPPTPFIFRILARFMSKERQQRFSQMSGYIMYQKR